MNEERAIKEVFAISERENSKAIWTRVGTAFVNRDNSLNILLDSIPLNGKLQVRDARPSARRAEAQ